MKRLGLDLGARRIGFAVSDEDGRLSFARGVLTRRSRVADLEALRRIVREEQAAGLVVGLPLRADGVEGDRALEARRLGELLAAGLGLPVQWQDESHSTEEARELLQALGLEERRIRDRVDAESARIILQRYLDRCPEVSR